VAALFAGIGGIELGLHRALGDRAETVLMCESWDAAQRVLAARFPASRVHPDVRTLARLPADTQLVTAGFPCTDLSQAGRTAGISGEASGLVSHVFAALRVAASSGQLPDLLVENVPNMLALDRGKAMAYLIGEIEALGYRWAYRVVDSRFTGVPQRRRRVILMASVSQDPRGILFADEAGPRPESDFRLDAFGFYWTEGRGGLGWAVDAVPTLKGGSTVGIPSPPAIWVPGAEPGRRVVKPGIEDAEAMQGFPRGWTDVQPESMRRNGPRWKLVGNAVTVRVAEWVGRRLAAPGDAVCAEQLWDGGGVWPTAAWGDDGKIWRVDISEFPEHQPYEHLLDVIDVRRVDRLSERATAGFLGRLQSGNLGRHPGFREDVAGHIEATRDPTLFA
jgi:DNA (cytosine-5)-methyltransferase 1